MKKVLYILFHRSVLVALSLLAQVVTLVVMLNIFSEYINNFYWCCIVLSVIAALLILGSRIEPAYKIAWLLLILPFPVFGGVFYLLVGGGHIPKRISRRMRRVSEQSEENLREDFKADDLLPLGEDAAGQARYLERFAHCPAYTNTETEYFALGDLVFPRMLEELKKAERYIFLEYFILQPGVFWDSILDILEEKAAHGVEVRLIYDDMGCIFSLPRDYNEQLAARGIQCRVFSPVQPFVSTHYNYRDHRKILVIDGRVGFTGGVNLADEYINHIQKHGRWKDAAVMLEGEAVRSLTAQFLQMWSILKEPEYEQFLTRPIPVPENAKGVAAPYGDCPLDGERVGEMVYIDLLNRARDYIHIMTPYLILDGELETALKFAAERGVDVHLILPGKPDKQFPYALAKSHYSALLDSGVKISEWSPGFVHAKVFVVDGREAVVGTINLDYRSLYHHFEDAVWMVDAPCIRDIEQDFQHTLEQCRTVENTSASIWQKHYLLRATGMLLKVIAPLL